MKKSAKKSFPARDTLLKDISGKLSEEIRKILNNTGVWKDLLRYIDCFDQNDIYEIECERDKGGKLMQKLAFKYGKDVDYLIRKLNDAECEKALMELVPYERVRITQQPEERVTITAGEPIVLETNAEGFPYPRYDWFVNECGDKFEQLNGQLTNTLNLKYPPTQSNRLLISCRIHNLKKDTVVWTRPTEVTIIKAPDPPVVRPVHQSPPPEIRKPTVIPKHYPQQFEEIDVLRPPCIVKQPQACTVLVGKNLRLSCDAVPSGLYQWYKDGVVLGGYNYSQLIMESLDPIAAGIYYCTVTNNRGGVTSDKVQVDVVYENPIIKPVIIQPEKEQKIKLVKEARYTLHCRLSPLSETYKYQWFKNREMIEGATSSDYEIKIKGENEAGRYLCYATNGKFAVLSPDYVIEVTKEECYAVDKVALLIGECKYYQHDNLKAPYHDLKELENYLKQMGFKVLTLVNLTKSELEKITEYFVKLLDEGVYGFVYISGHGFQYGNENYLIDIDNHAVLRKSDCFKIQYLLQRIQTKKPKAVMMFIDICRQLPSENNIEVSDFRDYKLEDKDPAHDLYSLQSPIPNQVIFYASSYGYDCFESSKRKTSVLASSLLRQFKNCSKGSIFTICQNVLEDIRNYLKKSKKPDDHQIPELLTNLALKDLSLWDPIKNSGHTEFVNNNLELWKCANECPQSLALKGDQIKFEILFEKEFSNVMRIEVTTYDPSKFVFLVTDNMCIVSDDRSENLQSKQNYEILKLPDFDQAFCSSARNIFYRRTDKTIKTVSVWNDLQKIEGNLTIYAFIGSISLSDEIEICGAVLDKEILAPLVGRLDMNNSKINKLESEIMFS